MHGVCELYAQYIKHYALNAGIASLCTLLANVREMGFAFTRSASPKPSATLPEHSRTFQKLPGRCERPPCKMIP